jgi:hypothetical protein
MVNDIGSGYAAIVELLFRQRRCLLEGGNMDHKTGNLQGIGRRLREEARHIVEAQLPACLAELLRQLELVSTHAGGARTMP